MSKSLLHEDYGRKISVKAGSNKKFGFVMASFFLLLFIGSLYKTGQVRIWSISVALLFLAFSVFKADLLNPLNVLWTKFGFFLNSLISPIILLVLYVVAFIPVGFLLKLFKKDILSLKKSASEKTYWLSSATNTTSTMKDQF